MRVPLSLRRKEPLVPDETPIADEPSQPIDLAEETVETLEANEEAPPQSVVQQGGTFESFRFRDFSLFWAGAFVSNTGSWMQNYALAIVVYSLRSSSLDLGIVNFVSGIPVLFLALPAGALADKVDKRTLLIVSQFVLMLQAAALAILYSTGHLSPDHGNTTTALIWIASLGLLGGVMSALTFPAWQSLLPDLVPRENLLNAIALNSAQFQSARLLGPLVAAGIVLLGAGMGEIFWVNAGSFLFVIAALWAIHPHADYEREASVPRGGAKRESSWRTITAGLRYARENRFIGVLIGSTAVMTIFGMPYMMLLPAYADQVILGGKHVVPEVVTVLGTRHVFMLTKETVTAYLMAANGLGAVAGALVVASLKRGGSRADLIPVIMVGFSVTLIGFSLSHWLWLSMLLSVAGGAGVLSINSLTNTTIQANAPGQLRGRVMALFIMSFMGLMPVSSLIFGPVGQLVGPDRAILLGAVVLLGWALFLVSRPKLLQPSPGAQ